MANVFISHRSTDLNLAIRLATDLRKLGHTVWLDADEISLGDSIVAKINQGLSGTNYLLLCLSSTGVVDPPWTAREWMSNLARQLNGVPVKTIPVALSGSDLPAILADIKMGDLTRDWNKGVAEINAALQ